MQIWERKKHNYYVNPNQNWHETKRVIKFPLKMKTNFNTNKGKSYISDRIKQNKNFFEFIIRPLD